MLLDADNIPERDPTFLFDSPQFLETGALFWPDFGRLGPDRLIWDLCGIEYRDEREVESGQIVIDKERCWKPLNFALWYNEHSDFYYNYIYGDKETFHLAWTKLNVPYSMPNRDVEHINDLICQHDFFGHTLFQHQKKWNLDIHDDNQSFLYRDECLGYLRRLQLVWSGKLSNVNRYDNPLSSVEEEKIVNELVTLTYTYRRIGYDRRTIALLPNGHIGLGKNRLEEFWTLERNAAKWNLVISSGEEGRTCILERSEDSIWRGNWLKYEQMPVELSPTDDPRADYDEALYTNSLPHGLSLTGKPVILSYGLPPDYSGMLEDHRERHEQYCSLYGYNYLTFTELISHHPVQWEKIARIRSLLKPDGPSYVFYFDADAAINRMDVDLRNALPEYAWLGLVINSAPWERTIFHWNTGVMYIRNCHESREFFDAVWNKYGRQYDPNSWEEQRAINILLLETSKYQQGLVTLPHEWNANISRESPYNSIVVALHGNGRPPSHRRIELNGLFSSKGRGIGKI